jgi:hypothetical protein
MQEKSMSLQAIKDVLSAHRIAKETAHREGVSHPPSMHVVLPMRIERNFTVC